MIRRILLFVIGTGGIVLRASAQEKGIAISPVADSIAAVNHVVRNPPRKFHATDDFFVWKMGHSWQRVKPNEPRKIFGQHGTVGYPFRSDDRQCIVVYNVLFAYPLTDAKGKSDDGFYTDHNLRHRNAIQADLLALSQGKNSLRFENSVRVRSDRKIRRQYHADSLFLIDIRMPEPLIRDCTVYTHCVQMYLSKKEHRHLCFSWFFTDEGYARRQKYMRAIEGKVYFKKNRRKLSANR